MRHLSARGFSLSPAIAAGGWIAVALVLGTSVAAAQAAATGSAPSASPAPPTAAAAGSAETTTTCPPGTFRTQSGQCVQLAACPQGQVRTVDGQCVALAESAAPAPPPPAAAAEPAAPAADTTQPPSGPTDAAAADLGQPPAQPEDDTPREDPTLGGGRVALFGGLGAAVMASAATDTDANGLESDSSGVGGFPSFAAGLALRQFIGKVSGINLDIEGVFSAVFSSPQSGSKGNKGFLGAGVAEVLATGAPRSAPVSVGAGLFTGYGGFDPKEGSSDSGLLLGFVMEGFLRFGKSRSLGLGLRSHVGGLLTEDGGALMDLHLVFEGAVL
ncbi:MAG: hypothetical protein JW940_38385 [Polyangiaceae bacterium]|nr:hypothetical protein [Polyangiaceae bacterium]